MTPLALIFVKRRVGSGAADRSPRISDTLRL
jgi:hypothetical protein